MCANARTCVQWGLGLREQIYISVGTQLRKNSEDLRVVHIEDPVRKEGRGAAGIPKLSSVCLGGGLRWERTADLRVVDVEDPVEDEVDAEREVDEVRVVLLDALVHRRQGVDHLDDVHQLVVLRAQPVLVERVDRVVHIQQIHCKHTGKTEMKSSGVEFARVREASW